MIALETERLKIRNFTANDLDGLYEMIIQYQASELAAYDQQWPTVMEEIQKVVEWFASEENYLAVCLKDSGRFIGFVSLNPTHQEGVKEYNLGYIFNFDYHGQGYATEACRAALDHAFHTLQADNVITGTAAVNSASCRLLERLGFKKTTESTGAFKYTPDGKPVEFLGYCYFLSKQEWQAGKK
jgi:ribosomal-protein-alanine N-acetyltransferase